MELPLPQRVELLEDTVDSHEERILKLEKRDEEVIGFGTTLGIMNGKLDRVVKFINYLGSDAEQEEYFESQGRKTKTYKKYSGIAKEKAVEWLVIAALGTVSALIISGFWHWMNGAQATPL